MLSCMAEGCSLMCNAFFQVIFRSVAAAASSVLLIQGINQILCQPNRISARPQRTPAGLAPPPARYLLVCGTAACFSSILLMELSFFMEKNGSTWQFMDSEQRPAPACIRCDRQSNDWYAPGRQLLLP